MQHISVGARAPFLLLVLSLCVSACATTPTQDEPENAALIAFIERDPMSKIPYTRRALERITPYTFELEGTRRFKEVFPILLESGEDATRLVLGRALLDALLYAELAGSDEIRVDVQELAQVLLGDLSKPPATAPQESDGALKPWMHVHEVFEQLLKVFEGLGVRYEPHAQACEEALELIQLLRTRSMDASYHAKLEQAARPGRLFSLQARVARVLDIHQAMSEVQARPVSERLSLLIRVLGPAVCDADKLQDALRAKPNERRLKLRAACARALCLAPHSREPQREGAALAACGMARWPQSISEDMYSAELGVVMALMAHAQDEVAAMHDHVEEIEPFSQGARVQLGELIARWSRRGLGVGMGLETADDLGRVRLVQAHRPTADLWLDSDPRYLVLDRDSIWVGLLPTLGVVHERPGFLEAERGWGFPGKRVADLSAGVWPEEEREVVVDHLVESLEVSLNDAREMRQFGPTQGRGVCERTVLMDSGMTWDSARVSLGVVRDACKKEGEQDVRLRVAFWDAEAQRAGALAVWVWAKDAFPHGRASFARLPKSAWPLYARVVVAQSEVTVWVRGDRKARIRTLEDDTYRKELARVLSEIRAQESGEELAIEVAQDNVPTRRILEIVALAQGWGAVGVF